MGRMQVYGDFISIQVSVLAAGLENFGGSDPLQRRSVTSHGTCEVLRKWEIIQNLNVGNAHDPTCIASTLFYNFKMNI
jgi:hypothetical protein